MLNTASLQVIEGGRVRPKRTSLNQYEQESVANRFLYHEAKLPSLAHEFGMTTTALAHIIAAFSRADGYEAGRRAERARYKFFPPMSAAA